MAKAHRGYSGQRTFPGDSGPSGEAFGRGPELADYEQPTVVLRRGAGELLSDPRDAIDLGGRSDPEDRGAAGPNKRQTPLRGGRRRRQRLRDGDAELVRRLLLGPAPDDP